MNDRQPPTHTLWAKLATRDGSKPKAIKIGSAWPNQFGGHNITLERGYQDKPGVAAIELTDGTRIVRGDDGRWSHFIDWRDEGRRQLPTAPSTSRGDDSDEIPF